MLSGSTWTPFAALKKDKARPLIRLAKTSLDQNWLHRWWCRKYNLPRSDPRYGAHTEEELLLEYFEDVWEKDNARALQMLGTFEDDVVFETGDPEVDEIERRLARGEDPDVVLKGWGDGVVDEAAAAEQDKVAEFEDDYDHDEAPDVTGTSWTKKG